MATNPERGVLPGWVSDKVDLDELFCDAEPIGDGRDWALPGFFSSDEEFERFQTWLRAERASGFA